VKLHQFNIFFNKQTQNNTTEIRTDRSEPHNVSNIESPFLLFEWKELKSLLTRQPSCSSVTQLNNPLTQTVLLQFSYPTEQSPDNHSPPAIQLHNWTIPWHTQPSCSSVTQLNNPLTQTALLQFSYTTEQPPETHSSPAVQLPNWKIPWHRQPSCSSVTQLNNLLTHTALLQFSYPNKI
jgi:hypothetical protein